jgi:pantoate--beta-alanine ligase
MRIAHTVQELRAARASLHNVGFVPTMGALHQGHRSLLARARAESTSLVASLFVNPLQFAPGEDLDRYPRTFDNDCAMLAERVDLLFAPSVQVMLPTGAVTLVDVPGIADRLDGASRPGHFRGVATIVAKLFHLVQPVRAYFGQKDAAQLAVLRRMVQDLNFPVELLACPTVRDPDGLALSSRNRYLSTGQRQSALALPQALHKVCQRIAVGERRAEVLIEAVLPTLAPVRLDYLQIVDPDALTPVEYAIPGSLVAVAAWVGDTRLIDNFIVDQPAHQ